VTAPGTGAAGAPAAREPQTFAGPSRVARYASLVKLPHTVFALPFALVGVVLASYQTPVTAATLGWVVLAFTAARFAAMAFNRVVDRDLDAANPRTASREIPSGLLGVREAQAAVFAASLVFVGAAWALNPLCGRLSPVALGWVLAYSYAKRVTRWSHLVLGLGLGIAPAGGYLAVTGRWSEPWWLLCALSLAVATWVGGFDIFYALQDEQFDRAHGLRSVPAALGVRGAIAVARGLHLVTVAVLSAVPYAVAAARPYAGGGLWLGVGAAVVAALLLWEHRLVRADDLSRLDAAFFTMNGVISIAYLACALVGRVTSHPVAVDAFVVRP
jgi:4-hydroxybenzoate polyprenyltransferase